MTKPKKPYVKRNKAYWGKIEKAQADAPQRTARIDSSVADEDHALAIENHVISRMIVERELQRAVALKHSILLRYGATDPVLEDYIENRSLQLQRLKEVV